MPSGIWKTSWKSGPAAHSTGPGSSVVVSVTEFTTHRPWGTPAVAFEGMRLRRGWPRTPGAVAVRLWMDPGPRLNRSGSVTVWADEASLMRFVARPDHLRVVRAFRGRGVMRSALRETVLGEAGAGLAPAADTGLAPLWADAERILTGGGPWS
ncbi:hypothetical protein ACIRD6_27530 [Streptomyces sp. NPDC102473]|uniref:hypothetical protein n=1 Tax=Streptomyces sp. NPDC102473 TaxID=3366180 RepID=UPI00380B58A2